MTIVSMETEGGDSYSPSEPNPYGYGLSICLTEEQTEALGLSANPPKPGSKVGIRGFAFVQRVTQEVDSDDDAAEDPNGIDVCMTLQITDLEVTPEGPGITHNTSLLYHGV